MKGKKLKCFLGVALSLCMMSGLPMPVLADDDVLEQYETIGDDGSSVTETDEALDQTEDLDDASSDQPELSPSDSDARAGQFNEDEREVSLPAKSVRLKCSQHNDLVIGEQFQIKYALTPLDSDDIVTFRSFNKKIARVDENGLVTAVGFGSTKVRVETASGKRKNLYFNVTDAQGGTEPVLEEVEAIEFAEPSAMIRKGKNFQIDAILYPFGVEDTITYTSSDKNVAKVSQTGLVTAVGEGSAFINVTAGNGVFGVFEVTVYSDILKGIDVSKWQDKINWKKVASTDIDFVMIRSSFGYEDTDICLEQNVAGCEKYGIDYGFYHYTYARNVSEARKEAKYFLNAIKDYDPSYPVVLDIEESFYKKMDRKEVTDIIVTFMSELEKAGYYSAIYSYATFFNDYVDMSEISKYDIWIASWGDEEKLQSNYNGHYGMWQYSAKGSVSGIDGDVDMDYAFKDYAELIKEKGLNGK